MLLDTCFNTRDSKMGRWGINWLVSGHTSPSGTTPTVLLLVLLTLPTGGITRHKGRKTFNGHRLGCQSYKF
eukprot:3519193-Rhodomonas_salina.3